MPDFHWLAWKDDGEIISQFNNGKETLFQKVLDEEESILFFQIYDEETFIAVDLEKGFFLINGITYHPCPELQTKQFGVDYRLVYYKRNTTDINLNTNKSSTTSIYIIGWQTTVDGVNIQRLVFFNPETYQIEIKEKR